MSRFDLLSGKKPKKLQDVVEHQDFNDDVEGIKSHQTSASRTMLIRGPNGYTLMVPLRSLRAQIRGAEDTNEAIIQLTLPKKQAHELMEDIDSAQNLLRSPAISVAPRQSQPIVDWGPMERYGL